MPLGITFLPASVVCAAGSCCIASLDMLLRLPYTLNTMKSELSSLLRDHTINSYYWWYRCPPA